MHVRFFGQYLLANGYVTAPQLVAALDYQASKHARIGDLAVEHGMISRDHAEEIAARQLTEDMQYGALAVHLGYLQASQVEQLVGMQRDNHIRLGEALQALGYLAEDRAARALEGFLREQERFAVDAMQVPHQVPQRGFLLRALELTERLLLRAWGVRTKRGPFVMQDELVLLSDRNALVRVDGDIQADYVLAVPSGIAREVAQRVVDVEHVSPEEQEDVVRELANVVCGHLAGSLAAEGKRAELSPPETLPFRWEIGSATISVQIPLMTHAGQVFLVVGFPSQPREP